MARPEQLPQGQIRPVAQPVDAFLRPADVQVAGPTQAPALPAPKGLETIQSGGRPNVGGYNNAAVLAEALAPFSKQAIELTQNAGLQYASWRMDVGEAKAKEALRRAQAANDQSTEAGQLEYAAANRAVAAKDPQAGWLMHMLDPYMQMGWERGKSKLAGQEIALGMDAYVGRNAGRINYLAPDQGFGELQKIRAEYISQVTTRYGIDDWSAGFQKYVAPEIEKASDKIAQRIAEDRVKFLDEQVPRQASAQVLGVIRQATADRQIEYKGQVYRYDTDQQMYAAALRLRLQEVVAGAALSSGLPGQATKRIEAIYTQLRASSDYNDNAALRQYIDEIPSNTPRIGSDGKAVMNPATGQPVMLTLGELYSKESIDSQLKYGKAGAEERKRLMVDGKSGFRDLVASELMKLPTGAAQQPVIASLAERFYNSPQNQNGARLSRDQLLKEGLEVAGIVKDFQYTATNENAEPEFFGWLQGAKGSDFNEKEANQRKNATANQIADPQKRAQFLLRADTEIKQAAKEEGSTVQFRTPRDKAINQQIEIDMAREYPRATPRNKQDSDAGRALAYRRYVVAADSAIQEWRAKFQVNPTDAQVNEIVKGAIYKLRKEEDGLDRTLYPGGKSGGPSLRPKPIPQEPAAAPAAGGGAKPQAKAQPAPKPYELGELDTIPNRTVVLKNYREQAVLELPDVWSALDAAADGKQLPKSLERAWRDAGARNAYEFLYEQLQRYPYQLKPGDQEVLEKARKRLVSQSAAVDALVAANANQQRYPSLASIGTWMMDVTMGTVSARAATTYEGGSRDGGGPFTGDVTRFRAAILKKESGGNYGAVNPDSGALGVGQVMPYNVDTWTQKYLGRRLTPQQFLRDRAAQDAVVNGRFRDMLADQKAAGYSGEQAIRRAAAVWYSGQAKLWNDTKPQYSNGRRYPSIAEYTKAIWDAYQRGG